MATRRPSSEVSQIKPRRAEGYAVRPTIPAAIALLMTAAVGCGPRETPTAPNVVDAAAPEVVAIPPQIELTFDGRDGARQETICRLVNRGDGEARIAGVRTACACTLAEPLGRTVLAPGEEVALRLKLSPPSRGRMETTVTVDFGPSAARPLVIRLVLHGAEEPVPRLASFPRELRLLGRRPGAEIVQPFEIGAIEDPESEPWIRGVAVADGDVEVVSIGTPAEKDTTDGVLRTYRFEVRGTAPAAAGRSERFSLRPQATGPTDYSGAPAVTYGLLATEPPVRLAPDRMTVRRSEVETWPVTRRVMVVTEEPGISVAPTAELPAWLTLAPVSASGGGRVGVYELTVAEPPAGEGPVARTVPFDVTDDRGPTTVDLVLSVVP